MRAVGRFRSMILSCAWLGVALSSSLGVVSAQEAWQTSWPGFVSRLAQILSSCRVPTEAELNNRFREKITFTNSAGVAIYIIDLSPDAGTCQFEENRIFTAGQVVWEAQVNEITRAADGTITLSLAFQPVPSDSAVQPLLANITSTTARLARGQSTDRISVGQRIRVQGSLPKPDTTDFAQGVTQVYGVGPNIGILRTAVNIRNALVLDAPPAISQNGVLNGASLLSGVSTGSWLTIFGTSLASTTRTWQASDFSGNKLPKSLDGVSVKVNGKDALVYFISPTQINALAPTDSVLGSVSVTVTNPKGTSTALAATLQTYSPAFFVFDPESRKYPAAVHVDGTLVGKPNLFGTAATSRPVRPGDRILLYGTGFGPTNPAVPADDIVSTAASLTNPNQLTIRIGGVTATVEFAGLTGSGLYQFNVVVPNVPPGDQALTAQIGGVNTQSGVFLTVTQ